MSDWIERLLDQANLTARSLRQYRIGLTYWETWHRLRYGTPLSLSEPTRQTVAPDVVNDFAADHTPVSRDGLLRMSMVDAVDKGLREAGYNRYADCATPRTTFWRVGVLNSAHRLANLPFDRRAALRQKVELNAIWEAELAAVGAPTAVPMSASTIVEQMLQACSRDGNSVRDAALIVLAQYLTNGQICQLKLGDWNPDQSTIDGQAVRVMQLDKHEPVGKIQAFARSICLAGDDEWRVRAWWAIRYGNTATASEPFFVREDRMNLPYALSDKWVLHRFRAIAIHAGLIGRVGRDSCKKQPFGT